MSKYDIHKDKNIPSDEDIAKYKNFDKVMKKAAVYDYKQATKPIYKNVKVLSIVAVIISVGLIILFEATEQEEATEELKKQTDSLTIPKKQPANDTLSSRGTGPIGANHQQPINQTSSHIQNTTTHAIAQSEVEEDARGSETILVTNSSAEYKGGEHALKHYLEKNIKYPYNAVESPYTGKVEVDLVIEQTGKVGSFTIYHSPNSAISKEITRVIKMMPDWNAAVKNNTPTVSTVTVYFPFKYIDEN